MVAQDGAALSQFSVREHVCVTLHEAPSQTNKIFCALPAHASSPEVVHGPPTDALAASAPPSFASLAAPSPSAAAPASSFDSELHDRVDAQFEKSLLQAAAAQRQTAAIPVESTPCARHRLTTSLRPILSPRPEPLIVA
jgi:hypothetical protein